MTLAAAMPAHAQETSTKGVYAGIGYARVSPGNADLDAIQGRLGYRFGPWVGVEAEVAAGLGSDTVGDVAKYKLRHQESLYAVGFAPLTPKLDLLARVGYGYTRMKLSIADTAFSTSFGQESWNFGGGVQYLVDGKNGLRAEYTRQEFIGGDADSDNWSIGYVRRF